ncbi:MAG: hypothetical protein IJ205_05835 [Bacteroidales bacterium]|nr:hypothetical protein [Bacteroidales bacterium]
MNNTFNFERFGKYLAYDLKSVWKEQRVFLVTYALIPIIIYILTMFFALVGHGFSMDFSDFSHSGAGLAARISAFSLASVIFLIFFPSRTYGFITDKAKGSAWIQLPASRLEKFASMMLICLVIIPVAFFCAYLLCDAFVCLVDKGCGSSILSSWSSADLASYEDGDKSFKVAGNGLWFLANGVLQIVSVFLLGALIFKKNKVAKTILTIFVISLALSAVMGLILSTIDFDSFGERVQAWAFNHSDNMDFWFNFWGNVELAVVVIGLGIWSWFRVKNVQH